MTNREWLATLSDKELSEFLTIGLCVRYIHPIIGNTITISESVISVSKISCRYIQSTIGLAEWLRDNQEFETIKDESEKITNEDE